MCKQLKWISLRRYLPLLWVLGFGSSCWFTTKFLWRSIRLKPAHKRTTYVESAYSWYAIEGSQLADGNDWNPSNRNADIEYRLPGEINRTFPFDSFRFILCWTFYSFFLPFFCLRSVVCSLIQPMKCLLRSFEVRCIHCRCVHIKYSIFVWITLLFMQ